MCPDGRRDMVPRTRAGLLVVPLVTALTIAASMGCKGAPTFSEYRYELLFPGPEAPAHAVILLGDRPIGQVYPAGAGGGQQEQERAHGYLTLPAAETLAAQQTKLVVRVQTPCRTVDLPLRIEDGTPIDPRHPDSWRWSADYEKDERGRYTERNQPNILVPATIEGYAAADFPETVVWIDRHVESGDRRRVTIGAFEAPTGEKRFAVLDLACAAEHDVKVDGTSIGTLVVTPGAPAYLVSTDPRACYRLRSVEYVHDGQEPSPAGPGTPVQFAAGAAHALPTADIGLFLSNAPSSRLSAGIVEQLTRVDCP